jgi:hypothetical protein
LFHISRTREIVSGARDIAKETTRLPKRTNEDDERDAQTGFNFSTVLPAFLSPRRIPPPAGVERLGARVLATFHHFINEGDFSFSLGFELSCGYPYKRHCGAKIRKTH